MSGLAVAEFDGDVLAKQGIDLEWPAQDEGHFGRRINDALARKGWCMIQMPSDDMTRDGVLAQAEQLTYEVPKSEFVPDLLGKNGSGKISNLGPDDSTAFFSWYDTTITELCTLIGPWTGKSMGFEVSSRTEGMVWTSYTSPSEEQKLKPVPLEDDDVEDGLIKLHLDFIRRRKLCCLHFVSTEGGTISLLPKESDSIELDISENTLLVFRIDEMMFQHDPKGRFTIYGSWALDDFRARNMQGVVANPADRNQLQGLIKGVALPLGKRLMIESMQCAVGGSSNDASKNWLMFLAATDGLIYVPNTRFDTDSYFAPLGEPSIPGQTSYQVHGGLVDDERLFCFDNKFFDIKDEEAPIVFPKQRLVMETGYTCLAQAGFTKETLQGKKISFFLGDCGTDWMLVIVNNIQPKASPAVTAALDKNITSSRLSYIMGMTGSTCSIDTACSSGLVAFVEGSTSLRPPKQNQFQTNVTSGPLTGTLCGGALVITGAAAYVGCSAASMLSHDGRCFTYNQSADGFARGEGCSLLYSRSITDDAEKAGMMACAVGAVTNQDGRSATITAPNGPSQTACTRASLEEGGVLAAEISASECHGTGTALGDPIEVGALIAIHGQRPNGTAFGMTSTKSNIGHGEDNAGSAGLFKCVMMAKYSTGTANCHLRTMNSNLVHSGFPACFSTDHIDMFLNSAISGVSSFGFGGANAHAEIWAQSQCGTHACKGPIGLDSYDQLTVTCPISMGQIDYLTGEPAINFEFESSRKVKADVLREPFADYGISASVYMGDYRFRPDDDDWQIPTLPYGTEVSICGSWSGWLHLEKMDEDEDNMFTTTVTLGNTRCESFFICIDDDRHKRIYPVVNNADTMIEVQGPNDRGEGKRWLIDGRSGQVPAGTTYKVVFSWTHSRRTIFWEMVSKQDVPTSLPSSSAHIYSFVGSFNSYMFQDLQPCSDEPNSWEGTFKIGESGREYMQLVRDHDAQQMIYPSRPDTASTEIPVRGPDGWGAGKHWLVSDKVGHTVQVRVSENDGHFEVAIDCQVWESIPGWGAHDYFLKSFTSSECTRMTMASPGIFKFTGTVSKHFSVEHEAYVESFQVLVDADPSHCFYPEIRNTGSGVSIAYLPDGFEHEENWLIQSLWPGATFEITFNLTITDRRKFVTWKLL